MNLHRSDSGHRVGVGVERQDIGLDELLDEGEGAPRGHVVAVDDGAHAERATEGRIGPDHA